MAQKTYVCRYCKERSDAEGMVKHGNRTYYHPDCLEEKLEKEAEERERKQKEREDWEELFEYICELHGIDTLTGQMFEQLKRYRDQYGYTHKGIYLSLKYFYEVLGRTVREGDGLGIIPYMYDKAKKHYIETRNVEEALNNIEDDLVTHTTVKTKVKKRNPHRQIINIEDL